MYFHYEQSIPGINDLYCSKLHWRLCGCVVDAPNANANRKTHQKSNILFRIIYFHRNWFIVIRNVWIYLVFYFHFVSKYCHLEDFTYFEERISIFDEKLKISNHFVTGHMLHVNIQYINVIIMYIRLCNTIMLVTVTTVLSNYKVIVSFYFTTEIWLCI